jgi:hypothetical protein
LLARSVANPPLPIAATAGSPVSSPDGDKRTSWQLSSTLREGRPGQPL